MRVRYRQSLKERKSVSAADQRRDRNRGLARFAIWARSVTVKLGGFRCSSNYRNRVLQRLAEELDLPKLTFQIIRRSIATLAQKKGTVKDVQRLLRHSRAATTTDVYMQEIPEGVQATVDSINQELRKRPGRKAENRKEIKICYQMLPNKKRRSL
jgi:integrase